jgi:hypothetical protein
MAKIKAGEIVEHLNHPMKRALGDAVAKMLPEVQVDVQELFREFRRAVGRRCQPWENVPNNCVDCD